MKLLTKILKLKALMPLFSISLLFYLAAILVSPQLFAQTDPPSALKLDPTIKFPANLLLLDDHITHHVAIVEKSTHKLHLFKNNGGLPDYIKSYTVATGKTSGDKLNNGDLKTPEGIYQIVSFLPDQELIQRFGEEGKIYGVGAFVMNYPNPIDARMNKTGSGIWLHSTDNESRISKGLDSRGCIVMTNSDLKDISLYIELEKTSMVIVQDLNFLREQTWDNNKSTLSKLVRDWGQAWRDENLEKYLSFYHPEEYRDNFRGSFNSFKNYKRSVFNNSGKPQIEMNNISILNFKEYSVVLFEQVYKSKTIDDRGKKTLYLKLDHNYQWKIVGEVWNKWSAPPKASFAFTPSMRFFKDSPRQDEI